MSDDTTRSGPRVSRQPSGRRTIGRAIRRHAPIVFGLAGLAVAQPILDLFGRNPEFFVAAEARPSEIVVFGLLAAFAVPLVLLVLDVVVSAIAGPRGSDVVHHTTVALLAALFGLVVARHIGLGRLAAVVPVAVSAAAIVLWARRFTAIGLLLRYLGFAPVLFLGLFLFASPTARLISAEDADVAQDVSIGVEAPVIFVILDEVPMSSLMTPDGSIDGTRFPAFARLADSSTWYRNTASVAPFTHDAVPAIVTGNLPTDNDLPTSADHPENLFTLLGGEVPLDVAESVTEFCPSDLCARSVAGAGDHLSRMVSDAAVVYGHLTLPRRFRLDLPPVDHNWGGFVGDDAILEAPPTSGPAATDGSAETIEEFFARQQRENEAVNGDAARGEFLATAIDGVRLGPDTLFFAHEVFPHNPWNRTPSGGAYVNTRPLPGLVERIWSSDESLIGQGFQRHLLQVGYADTLLGELLDRIEASGRWEESLVVVVADHGVSFEPGTLWREPTATNADELYRVPLFIKAPGQTDAVVDDRVASTVDILPTIVDLLDVEVDWTFDGVSLRSPESLGRTKAPVVYVAGPDFVSGGLPALLAVVERNERRVPSGQGWTGVLRLGPFGAVVGKPAAEIGSGTVDRTWAVEEVGELADYQPGRDPVLVLLHGSIGLDGAGRVPVGGVLALNGRAAGVAVFQEKDGDGTWTAVVDEEALRPGGNDIELYVGDSPDSLLRVTS